MTYKIGYGRPPKNNQFRTGQSGNAKGRPVKKARNNGRSDDMIKSIDKLLRRKIEIIERGVPKMISVLEATISKQIHKALVDGDQKALSQVFKLAEKAYCAALEGQADEPLRIIIEGGLPDD